jgi:hypothetical protein
MKRIPSVLFFYCYRWENWYETYSLGFFIVAIGRTTSSLNDNIKGTEEVPYMVIISKYFPIRGEEVTKITVHST